MSDAAMIIMPHEVPDLARQWKATYGVRTDGEPPPLGLRDRLRARYFRKLARGYVPGTRSTDDGRIDGAKVRRILLVRYDALGDYICSTGLITWLRAGVPHAEIDMITSPRNDAIARLDPFIDRTYQIDYQFRQVRPASLEPARRAAERDYDVVIGLAMTRMSKLAALTSYIAPRAEKVVLRHHERARIYGELFTHQVERIAWTDHWANTFTRQGAEVIAPVAPVPPLPVDSYLVVGEEAWRGAERFMRDEGIGFGGFGPQAVLARGWHGDAPIAFDGAPYAILNISAFERERQMAGPLAVGIARGLLARDATLRLYVTGAPAEIAQVESIVAAVASERCRVLAAPLAQFICIVAGARLLVSPDTATVHIAAIHGRPVVGLYSEKVKVAEWHPVGPLAGNRFAIVLSGDERTINVIPPETVVEAAERVEPA